MKKILVTSYMNPDLDGTACAVAYSEFKQKTGKDTVAGVIGGLHIETEYVLNRFNLKHPLIISNIDNFDEVILVDTSNINGLNEKAVLKKVIEIIDHRKVNDSAKFPTARIQIEAVGAAATLIAEKFMYKEIGISKASATLLSAAIISNTLNFKGGVTTNRDRKAFTWLNKIANLSQDFWKDLFQAKSDLSGKKLADGIKGDLALLTVNNSQIGIAQLEIVGARKLINERCSEIIQILNDIKNENNLDLVFMNIIELEDIQNFFITDDLQAQKLLGKMLNVSFRGLVAERKELIMRKQIVPLLKQELEGN